MRLVSHNQFPYFCLDIDKIRGIICLQMMIDNEAAGSDITAVDIGQVG